MKSYTTVMIAVCMAATMQVFAQSANSPNSDNGRPPQRAGTQGRTETLNSEQIKQVKQILPRYDAASLNAEKARAIHDAFREAGLRGGPAMADTIKAAGFDPDKLRDLAPPPDALQSEKSGTHAAPREDQNRRYSVEQAISDRAQLHTVANTNLPPHSART